MASVAVALAVALGVERLLTGLLFYVRPIDPFTLAAMAMLFWVVSAVAIVLSAWQASRIGPAVVLREQ
jgi:ABC-type lipoprotein release transport system permease subunit